LVIKTLDPDPHPNPDSLKMLDPQHCEKMSCFVHTVYLPRMETHFTQHLLAVTEVFTPAVILLHKKTFLFLRQAFARTCQEESFYLLVPTVSVNRAQNYLRQANQYAILY
jgi:hypothetical protein